MPEAPTIRGQMSIRPKLENQLGASVIEALRTANYQLGELDAYSVGIGNSRVIVCCRGGALAGILNPCFDSVIAKQ